MASKIDRQRTKFLLDEKDIPTKWYNIQADFKTPAPPVLHPGTKQPIGPADLAPLFPMELIKQEVSRERWIEIPDEVRDVLRLWRPSPLYRARRLEKALGTPAHIYYKYEGVSRPAATSPTPPSRRRTTTRRKGHAAQHRDRRRAVGLRARARQPDVRPAVQGVHGQGLVPAEAVSPDHDGDVGRPGRGQPQPDTQSGKKVLEQDPNSPGSLGIAISEAVEDAATRDDTKYSLGSVLNHVLMHQTVIGSRPRSSWKRRTTRPTS